jgi:hypothetical protein
VSIKASDLTFGSKPVEINDHVRVVEVTGGRIAVDADLARAPFTKDFLAAVGGVPSDSHTSTTVDIAQHVRDSGTPVRIATQQVDGKWYPSLLYTIADNATTSSGLQAPSAADRIPAAGASSPDDAVKSFVEALLQADVQRAAELLSPDELAVVHDYGKLILDRIHYSAVHAEIRDITFTDTPGDDGTRVTLKSIEVVGPDGSVIKAAVDGDCTDVTVQGQSKRFCAADLIDQLGGAFGRSLTSAQRTALTHLFSGATKAAGLETTQIDGKWYLNPVRSYFSLADALLSGLQGNDGQVLLQMVAH